MIIVEEEAYVVKKVLSLYNDGNGMSSKQIVEMLDQEGVRTRLGSKLQSNMVLRIWQNKDLYQGKRQNKYGYYPPII